MEKSKRDRYSLNFRLSYNKQDKVYVSNSTTMTSVNSWSLLMELLISMLS